MKKQLSKRDLRMIAKMYAAIVVYNSAGTGAGVLEFSECDCEYFQHRVHAVAGLIAAGLPNEVFKLASLDDVIKYVLNENR